jgi:hypothetical protein
VTLNTKRFALLLAIPLLALALVACGGSGGDSPKFPKVLEPKDGEVIPILANSELVVGQNRVAVGVLAPDGKPIVGAKVHFAFYDLNGSKETKKAEMDAVSRVPAKDAGIPEQQTITRPDGSKLTIFNAGEDVGVYTAIVDFDTAGEWGVEIKIDSSSPKLTKTLLPRFQVLAKGFTPAVGAAAPKSKNLTAADVSDISQIDSSAKPSTEMHTSTIAAAIAAGKPTLVLFAVPGFCESRLCGPELEIMRKLYPKYKDKAEFIHVEFYKNPGSPNRIPADVVAEWNLRSEPWFFVIDSKGIITAKFEGPTSLQELDDAVSAVVPK